MNCTVIGLGYIGLPTAALIANNDYEVFGFDVNKKILSMISKSISHILEPDLNNLLNKVINSGKLKTIERLKESDVFIICVPTPLINNSQNHIPLPDISKVLQAGESIASVIKPGNLVILESTSPVGTSEKLSQHICKISGLNKEDFNLAYCPERVIPGKIISELINNDRVVGGINKESTIQAYEFYKSFCKGEIYKTKSETAELIKLSENAYRDVNIAFANELSIISDSYGIDSNELINLANKHPRVNILTPGCGVGGHCIAIDPWFIVSQNPELTKLIHAARKVNNDKTIWTINKIINDVEHFRKNFKREPKVGLLGLTYKPDIDDLRESPSLLIMKELISKGINVFCHEPNIKTHNKIKLYSKEFIEEKMDILIFLVANKSFLKINLSNKVILDFCGITKIKR